MTTQIPLTSKEPMPIATRFSPQAMASRAVLQSNMTLWSIGDYCRTMQYYPTAAVALAHPIPVGI